MVKKSGIAVAMLAMSGLAQADGYVGLGFGQASADVEPTYIFAPGSGISTSVDDTDTAFKIFAGYEFTPNIAVEAGYADFGKLSVHYTDGVDSVTEAYETNALFVSLIGSVPLGAKANLFGKIGFADWEIDYTQTATAGTGFPSGTASVSGTDPLFGVGVSFNASDNLAIRAEFERYKLENNGAEADLDVLGVSGILKF